uniref:Uncharacterized protein n=1 Tax=Malurus cyaneus samueli TaxID=2593467 RepID=A0A8C5U5S0_9PASS
MLLLNTGGLSLASVTLMRTWTVPDLTGSPPSTAISTNSKELCFSRSNAFSSTNSSCFFPPGFSFRDREKDGLLLSW